MPALICKARYFRMGENAPKNSCFKGTVSPASIFGGSNSYFNYTERYNDRDKEKESLIDYTGRYEHTMTSYGFLDTGEKRIQFKEKGMECLSKEGSVVYEIICSIESYDKADDYHLTNQDQFSSVVSNMMPSYIRAIGLDPKNVTWWEDFHPENRTSITPHPHIHLLFYENEPSHTFDHLYGKLPRKALNDFKRMFANEMIKRQDYGRYREIFNDINMNKAKVLDRVKHINLDNVKTVRDLYAILPEEGRLQINSFHMAPYRETIYRVVDDLLESKKCRESWRGYVDALEHYDDMIDSQNRYEISARKETEIAKTREQIANTILKTKKDFTRDSSYEKLLSNENHRPIDGEKGKTYKDPDIVRDRLSSRNPEPHVNRLINGLLAQRQKEIEREIETFLDMDKDKGYDMTL
ncbi:MAG: hypothetical protein IJI66_15910 [Erysipelotrichaceae bacterium]|nr:hypothetical protein [Erysipelotrichaceae bacterium]